MNNIWDLLEDGFKSVTIDDNHKEAVLVLGNSGSGKSSLITLLAFDNSKYFAIKQKGTSTYVLDDQGVRIGHNISSTTKIPELIIDNNTNISYYDCPGFNDNRSTEQDLASEFFVKYVADHITSVKVILTVIYSSLRLGMDKMDLIVFLRHATTLVKDLQKFRNSIGLVVTKVENIPVFEDGQYKLVSDESILESIGDYLDVVKKDFEGRAMSNNTDRAFNEKAIALIDILKEKKGNTLKNIALFRQADRPGKVSEIPALQQNKKQINEMLENLKYTQKVPIDFDYTISEKSKNDIHLLVDDIDSKIAEIGVEIIKITKKSLDDKELQSTDLTKTSNIYNTVINQFTTIAQGLNKITSPLDYLYLLTNNTIVSEDLTKRLKNHDKFLTFLNALNGSKLTISPFKWILSLTDYRDGVLKNSALFYNFVNNFYEQLSSYSLQRNRKNSDVQALVHSNDWESIKTSLERLNLLQGKLIEFDALKHHKLDSQKVELMKNIISVTLQKDFTVDHNYEKILVTGNFIKLSDIIERFKNEMSVNEINIYAANKIFIDENIALQNRKISLTIISPIWEIVGRQTIDLSGKSGEPWSQSKAKSGGYFNGKYTAGEDGEPGKRGGAGGVFLGIGSTFYNDGDLIIISNGGSGGPGQSGGDGVNGRNGEAPSPKPTSTTECPKGGWVCRTPFSFGTECEFTEHYTNQGTDATDGTDGGDGGVGGLAGQMGEIVTIGLDRDPKFETKTIQGADGSAGSGGIAGNGGKHGNTVKGRNECSAINEVISSSNTLYYKWTYTIIETIDRGTANNGRNGGKGNNMKSREFQDKAPKAQDTKTVINEYKTIMEPEKASYKNIKKPLLQNFLDKIGSRSKRSLASMFYAADSVYSEFYVRNTASMLQSPLNYLMQSLESSIRAMHEYVSKSTENIFHGHKTWLQSSNENFGHPGLSPFKEYNVSFNANLLLVDVFLRKFTKSKLIAETKIDFDSSLLANRGYILNSMDEFDESLKIYEMENDLPPGSIEYDPILLMNKLNEALVNGKIFDLNNILQTAI